MDWPAIPEEIVLSDDGWSSIWPETYFRLLSRLRVQGGFSLQGFWAIDVIASQDFLGQFPVPLGAAGSRIIQRHRLAIAWRFR